MAGDGHAGTWVVVYVGVREGMRSVCFGGGVGGNKIKIKNKNKNN